MMKGGVSLYGMIIVMVVVMTIVVVDEVVNT